MKELAMSVGVTVDKNTITVDKNSAAAAACGTPADSSEASSVRFPSGDGGRVTTLAFWRRAGSALFFCVRPSITCVSPARTT